VPTEVLATPRAEQQIGRLSRKHSKAFESFLIDEGLEGAVLTLHDGSRLAGVELRSLVERPTQMLVY